MLRDVIAAGFGTQSEDRLRIVGYCSATNGGCPRRGASRRFWHCPKNRNTDQNVELTSALSPTPRPNLEKRVFGSGPSLRVRPLWAIFHCLFLRFGIGGVWPKVGRFMGESGGLTTSVEHHLRIGDFACAAGRSPT